jgi:hypothetical protein
MFTSLPTRPIAASKSPSDQRGQAVLLMLGVLAAVLAGVLVLFGFGQALGARGHAQRAADLSAVSAAQVMRRNFSRLFEPAALEGGVPNRATSRPGPIWRSPGWRRCAAPYVTASRGEGLRWRSRGATSPPRA